MSYLPLLPHRPITVDALYSIHQFQCADGFFSPGETHSFWELLYVERGTVHVQAGQRQLELTSGQMIFHPPGEFHVLSAAGGMPSRLMTVGFSAKDSGMEALWGHITTAGAEERGLLSRIAEESAAAFAGPLGDPSVHALIRKENAPFGAEQRVVSCLEALLIRLIRRQFGTPEAVSSVPAPGSDWMAAMDAYLTARLDRPLTLEEICRDNLIGRSQLQKRFHEQTGGGVMAYFAKLKIQTARRLIQEGALNITQISAQLGYQSVHYFSRHFKQHTGMSPSQYAKSVKVFSQLSAEPDDYANKP